MDSQYVYDGLKGAAFRWRAAGWVGQSGPVCNVDLWIQLLELVDTHTHTHSGYPYTTIRWLRVPSHTDIPGNERADGLAEEGRIGSPLYHVLSLPDRPVIDLDLPSTPTPRRAPAVPRSLNINDVIMPSGDTRALCMSAHPPRLSSDLDLVQPMSLDFSECVAAQTVVSDSSNDTASTVSLHESEIADDPRETWALLGLTALVTPEQPRRRHRPNTPGAEASF